MGLIWFIADKKKKIFYELGKGSWYDFDPDKIVNTDRKLLISHIGNIIDFYYSTLSLSDKFHKYVECVVDDLLMIFNSPGYNPSNISDLLIVNDAGEAHWIMQAKGYTCVGTRYSTDDKQSKEYIDGMKWNNQHLDGSERSKRDYNTDNYRKDEEWDMF